MKTEIVKFHDNELVCFVNEHGEPFVSITEICNSIGIDSHTARINIKEDVILSEGSKTYTFTQKDGDKNRPYFCLSIHLLHGWLFSIPTNRVNKESRASLILFKKECYKALYDHFFGKEAKKTENLLKILQLQRKREGIKQEIKDLQKEGKTIERKLENLRKESFSLFETETPELDSEVEEITFELE